LNEFSDGASATKLDSLYRLFQLLHGDFKTEIQLAQLMWWSACF